MGEQTNPEKRSAAHATSATPRRVELRPVRYDGDRYAAACLRGDEPSLDEVRSERAQLAYGFAPVRTLQRLGLTPLGPMPLLVRPLRLASVGLPLGPFTGRR